MAGRGGVGCGRAWFGLLRSGVAGYGMEDGASHKLPRPNSYGSILEAMGIYTLNAISLRGAARLGAVGHGLVR